MSTWSKATQVFHLFSYSQTPNSSYYITSFLSGSQPVSKDHIQTVSYIYVQTASWRTRCHKIVRKGCPLTLLPSQEQIVSDCIRNLCLNSKIQLHSITQNKIVVTVSCLGLWMKKLFIAQICFVFPHLPSTWSMKSNSNESQANRLIFEALHAGHILSGEQWWNFAYLNSIHPSVSLLRVFNFLKPSKKPISAWLLLSASIPKVCLAFKHKDGTWYTGHRFLLAEKYISHNKRDVTLKAERFRGSSLLKPEEIETYVFTVFEGNHSIYHKKITELKNY